MKRALSARMMPGLLAKVLVELRLAHLPTQKLKGLVAASFRLKTLNDNLYICSRQTTGLSFHSLVLFRIKNQSIFVGWWVCFMLN